MNETNFENDLRADDLFIESDMRDEVRLDGASPDDVPVWIENEDGSGQWSDGWVGDDEFEPEYPSDDDTFFCYEDGDEWLGTGGEFETGDWIGPSDADPGL
tara:strand:- start:215 stop:517 length:303 start_codon:yes stop_codon:yes gene_type:complete